MILRHHAARFGAFAAAAAVVLLVTAPPAVAATTGVFLGHTDDGTTVRIGGHSTVTALLGLRLEDGTLLKTYCVELDVQAQNQARMVESPWSEYPDAGEQFNAHPEKVLWILHNSYPNVAVGPLSEAAGTELDMAAAIAGTQAAIWHFSNGADLDGTGNPANIIALYTYLTGPDNIGVREQPEVSLGITPEGAEAKAGQPAGPFTVDTTADEVRLTTEGPDGVGTVDGNGAPLTVASDGTQFWLSAPAGGGTGEATVKAAARADVHKGRLFVGVDNEANPTQTLIVAASSKAKAKARASAMWVTAGPPATTPAATTTPVPPAQGGPLPETGASVLPALALALVLLGAGIGALVLQRRRRGTS